MKSNYKRLGDFIREVDIRNSNLTVTNLIGVSMEKRFIPSVANTIGVDLSTYKIIQKGQLGCKLMSVGRDEKLPVDLYKENSPSIVSSAYYVFEPNDTNQLLAEFLMMWLCRSENDRYIGFIAGGDVRGGISWDTFCDLPILVPSIDEQRSLVDEYNKIQNRLNINLQIIQKLELTIRALYKEWFFENRNEHWETKKLGDVAEIKAGGDKPEVFSVTKTESCSVPIYSNSSENKGIFGYTNKASIFKNSITISARGAIIGYTVLRTTPFVPIVRLIVVTPKQDFLLNYLYDTIKQFKYDDNGSAQGQLTIPDISSYEIIIPEEECLKKYQELTSELTKYIEIKSHEIQKLEELKSVLLAKLASSRQDL